MNLQEIIFGRRIPVLLERKTTVRVVYDYNNKRGFVSISFDSVSIEMVVSNRFKQETQSENMKNYLRSIY